MLERSFHTVERMGQLTEPEWVVRKMPGRTNVEHPAQAIKASDTPNECEQVLCWK